MILPRRILGDKSSPVIPKKMIEEGCLKINVYRNCDYKEMPFQYVASTFEITIISYMSILNKGSIKIARGLDQSLSIKQILPRP